MNKLSPLQPTRSSTLAGSSRWLLLFLAITLPLIITTVTFLALNGSISLPEVLKPAPTEVQRIEPIQFPETALSASDIRPKIEGWMQDNWIKDAPERSKAESDFLTAAIACELFAPIAPSGSQLSSAAEALSPDPKNDPVLAYLVGIWHRDSEIAVPLLRETIEVLKKTPGHESTAWMAAVQYANRLLQNATQDDYPIAQAAANQAIQLLTKALDANGGYADEDDWVAEYILLGYGTGKRRPGRRIFLSDNYAKFGKVASDHPDLPAWLKYWIVGLALNAEGWEARGGGYSDTVTEKAWQIFYAKMAQSAEFLEKAHLENPNHPGPAASRCYVAMTYSQTPIRDMRKWFDLSTAAQIDYARAYGMMLWGLRPRWHGSKGKMIDFGRECMNSGRFDSNVPWEYLTAHRDIASEWDLPDYYFIELRKRTDFETLFAGFEASPEREPWRSFDRSRAAVFWYKCQEYTKAWPIIEQLDFEVDARVLEEWGLDSSAFLVGKTAAFASPAGEILKEAEDAEVDFDADTAVALYRQGLETPGVDDKAKLFLRDHVVMMEMESQLSAGEKFPFLPLAESEGAGWVREGDHWNLKDGLTWKGGSDRALFTALARIGPIFSMTGEIEIDPGSSDQATAFVAYGYPGANKWSQWASIRFQLNKGEGIVSAGQSYARPRESALAPLQERFTFDLSVDKFMISVKINGEPVITDVRQSKGVITQFYSQLGLGISADAPDASIRFTNVELRKEPQE